MQSFRFWRLLEEVATVGGRRWRLRAWGGSNEGVAAAEGVARRRLGELRAAAQRSGGDRLARYEYGAHALREEWLSLVAGSEAAPEALVTRNRYGAPVLNAARLAFFDVDFPEPSELGRLAFWRRPPDPAAEALARVHAFAAANPTVSLRLYRTPAGLRVVRVDAPMEPTDEVTARWMGALQVDPLYASLCRRQRCFRARLGPKPWRVGLAAPPGVFPREGAAVDAFERWLARYEEAARGVQACRFVEALGPGRLDPALAPLVRLHDEASGALHERPLA